ncbi:hypothetical protein [Mangrovibacterium lignilyticum]|uniref:hypothetical protein n=1 Tax=Mangrovibacterium lignilyticum TaxID=2668052 RepID=UPI0013D0CB67|nr:hypothetical protein [Mangrovibacterium lignilyticum]
MKTKFTILLMATLVSLGASAQNYHSYNVRSVGYDMSDNLDLEAVAYLFGESQNLQEFEERLNDPRMQISNLDLNNDGFVDYLRVVELYEYGIHSVTIQAVLDRNIFQDVATFDVGRQTNNHFYVQVVGDPYLYGPNYIINPVYVHAPLILSWFLRPTYVVWHSPYYWGYYPSRYRHYRCLPTYRYHKHLHVHVDYHVNTYHYSNSRYNPRAVELQRQVHRNDYGQRHPDRSFSSRNSGYSNKYEMNRNRSVNEQRQRVSSSGSTSSSRPGYSQRTTTSTGTGSSTSTTTQSSRSKAEPLKSGQQKRSYESSNSANQSYTRGQSSSTNSGRSTYQRNEAKSNNSTNSNSGASRQAKVKTSPSSNSGSSAARSTQSRKVESSKSRKSSSANVSRSSRSSGQSVAKQSSSGRKEQAASSKRSSSSGEKKQQRSRRN